MRVGKDNSTRERFEEILSGRSLLWMKRRRSVRLDYLQVDCVRSNLLLRSVVAKCGWQVLAGKPDEATAIFPLITICGNAPSLFHNVGSVRAPSDVRCATYYSFNIDSGLVRYLLAAYLYPHAFCHNRIRGIVELALVRDTGNSPSKRWLRSNSMRD